MAMYHQLDLSKAGDTFGHGLYGVTGCVLPFLVEYSTSRADKKFQDEVMAIANCKTHHHLFHLDWFSTRSLRVFQDLLKVTIFCMREPASIIRIMADLCKAPMYSIDHELSRVSRRVLFLLTCLDSAITNSV